MKLGNKKPLADLWSHSSIDLFDYSQSLLTRKVYRLTSDAKFFGHKNEEMNDDCAILN